MKYSIPKTKNGFTFSFRGLGICLFLLFTATIAMAQPAVRRNQQVQQSQAAKKANNGLSVRSQISFPTALALDEDVVWRRDIYRELDLNKDANAGLYYPVEPVDGKMNLFTYLFKLILTGNVKAYEYRLDGNESFSEEARVKPLTLLDNYHIYYERTDRGVHIDDSDIPSREVTAYYIKESAYFDQASATFHKKVLALCPILKREDDFGDNATSYPLFWVKYDELAPFLAKHTMMTSNLNNAAVMSSDDFFTKNLYKGTIYKTNNMLGKTLAQYCPTDEEMKKEQKRIEEELTAFEKGIWGNQARKDSLDSIAKLDPKVLKAENKKNKRVKTTSKTTLKPASTPSKQKEAKPKTSPSSGNKATRMSVRRERH